MVTRHGSRHGDSHGLRHTKIGFQHDVGRIRSLGTPAAIANGHRGSVAGHGPTRRCDGRSQKLCVDELLSSRLLATRRIVFGSHRSASAPGTPSASGLCDQLAGNRPTAAVTARVGSAQRRRPYPQLVVTVIVRFDRLAATESGGPIDRRGAAPRFAMRASPTISTSIFRVPTASSVRK